MTGRTADRDDGPSIQRSVPLYAWPGDAAQGSGTEHRSHTMMSDGKTQTGRSRTRDDRCPAFAGGLWGVDPVRGRLLSGDIPRGDGPASVNGNRPPRSFAGWTLCSVQGS